MENVFFDQIDQNTPERYTLSIRLTSDGFCFSLCDHNNSGQILPAFYRTDPVSSEVANIKEFISAVDEIGISSFRRVNVIIDGSRASLIPFVLFDKDDLVTAFELSFKRFPAETLLYQVSDNNEFVVIFPVNKYVKQLLDNAFCNVEYRFSGGAVLDYVTRLERYKDSKGLLVCKMEKGLQIFGFGSNELLFFNCFECEGNSDSLYFIMNVWKTLGLSQMSDYLFLASDGDEGRELSDMLCKYIGNVERVEKNRVLNDAFSRINVSLPFDYEIFLQ